MPKQNVERRGAVRLEEAKARKFFDHLKDCPFVTIVFDGDYVYVYTKRADVEHIEEARSLLGELGA